MSWLRLYTDLINDPKVMQLECKLFRTWISCLCIAKQRDGVLPDLPAIAFALRLKEETAKQHIDALIESNLLDITENGLIPHNWANRQYLSDTSKARTQKYRKARYDVGLTSTGYLKHRTEVLIRDGGECVYCGSTKNLVLDHVIPVVRGGDDSIENLVAACKLCNSGKSGRLLAECGMRFRDSNRQMEYESRLQLKPVTVTGSICHSHGDAPRVQIQIQTTDNPLTPAPQSPAILTPDDVGYWVDLIMELYPTPADSRAVLRWVDDNDNRLSAKGRDRFLNFMTEVQIGLEEWVAYWAGQGNQFVPDVMKWLHGNGWKKHPPKPKPLLDGPMYDDGRPL